MKDKKDKLKAKLPRGFKDYQEDVISLRNAVSYVIKNECQKYAFSEIDTSIVEYSESLGKFLPDSDRPEGGVFSFQDEDGQWLSLRYDLTAPLARYVAENYQYLNKPFKRYQTGLVFRNEKPGPGRFREFLQFDADVIGIQSSFIDAELCIMVSNIFLKLGLGFDKFCIKYSNRQIWDKLFTDNKINIELQNLVLRAIDKKDRIGEDGVKQLLMEGRKDKSGDFMKGVGLSVSQASNIIEFLNSKTQTNEQLEEFNNYLSNYKDYPIVFDPSIVRGLDYYTGMVFEAELLIKVKNDKNQNVIFGSVAGGGRYDKLVSRFGGEDIPATGISIGVDRLIVALKQENLLQSTKQPLVVVANMDENLLSNYLEIADEIRANNIACEISFGNKNLTKQLKYCDKKNADVVIIAGQDEFDKKELSIKNLALGKKISENITERSEWKEQRAGQLNIPRDDLINQLKKILKTE